MKDKQAKPRLAFLIQVSNDSHFHVYAEVVRILPDDLIRNPGSFPEESPEFQDFRVSSQGNTLDYDNRPVPAEKRTLYAWECEYSRPHCVQMRDAERMYKTLQRVERRLSALFHKWGAPQTFGAYLLRVADAIGVSKFYFYHDDRRKRSSYDDSDYIILDPATGASRVDNLVYTWQHENEPAAECEPCQSTT